MDQTTPGPAPLPADTPWDASVSPYLTFNKRDGRILCAFATEHAVLPLHMGESNAAFFADTLLAMVAHPGAVEAYARALKAMTDPRVPEMEPRRFAIGGEETV